MKPIKRGELHIHIKWARAKRLDTGEEITLATKGDSNCHFFEPFEVGSDSVTLRLDWSSIDTHGHPTLDADFYCKETRKKRTMKGERKEAHHTESTAREAKRYLWEFRGCEFPFSVSIGWLSSATFVIEAACKFDAEVVKKPSGKSES